MYATAIGKKDSQKYRENKQTKKEQPTKIITKNNVPVMLMVINTAIEIFRERSIAGWLLCFVS